MSQYWMNDCPEVPSLAKMNCSQPRQAGLGERAQAVLTKKSVFNCSENAFAAGAPTPLGGLLSLVTPDTLSNEPIELKMNPLGALAEMSSPLPTTMGRGVRWGSDGAATRGVIGVFGGVTHADFCQATSG